MGSPHSLENKAVLVLFDGVCNFCNGAVNFLIKQDHKGIFKFASLQSDFAKSQLRRFNLNPDALESFVLIDETQCLSRSDAALHIAKRLGGPWKIMAALKYVPKFIRDGVYNIIATNRYRLFGKRDQCMIPTPEVKERFVT